MLQFQCKDRGCGKKVWILRSASIGYRWGQLCTYGFDDNKGNMSNFVVLGCGNTGHFTNLGLESPAIVWWVGSSSYRPH